MNSHIDDALRALDVAVPTLSSAERERAEATLERIIASPSSIGAPLPTVPAPARRHNRRLALVPMAALALIAGTLLVQSGEAGSPAYASWTAEPSTVSGNDLEAVASVCRAQLRHPGSSIDVNRAYLALAERRGDFVALLYRTDDPDMSAACRARNPQGSDDVDNVEVGVGGSTGPALEPGSEGLTQGAVFEYDYGASSMTEGGVGEAVTGVIIHAGDFTVNASVNNGRFAAWWPGPAFEHRDSPPEGEAGPVLALTYDLVLSDGTVVRDVQPTLPS